MKNTLIPHTAPMVHGDHFKNFASQSAAVGTEAEHSWVNGDLTTQERNNVALVNAFWECWREIPFDINKLKEFFHPNVTVRTGWRGEHVVQGRAQALEMYATEVQRQTEHQEVTDFRFPIVVAKGSVVFHTWVWIAHSDHLGYHIERPMASSYLITDGLIERWDSYCTGPESEPGYVGGGGLDGL